MIRQLLVVAAALLATPAQAQMNSVQCARMPSLVGCQNRGLSPAVPAVATIDVAIAGKTYSLPLTQIISGVLGQPNGPAKLDGQGNLFVDGGSNPSSIYSAIFPGVTFSDKGATSFVNPPGEPLGQRTGWASYFRNQAGAVGIGNNAVGFFASGTAEVDGAASWMLNGLLQDAASRATGAGVGRFLIGGEFDFNVMNPTTKVIGVSVGGNSLAQPADANGFIVNSLGNGNKWTGGFVTINGAVRFGLAIGSMEAAGIDVPSQPAIMRFRDHAGAEQVVTLQAVSASNGTNGFLSLTSTGGVDLTLNGRTLFAGGVNVGNSTFTGSIYATALPACAPSPGSGSVCRDTTTNPATLKVIP